MMLREIDYFTEQVERMSNFYRDLLDAEPVTQSDTISIFFVNNIKIFIHQTYSPREGELPPENHHAFLVEDVDAACQRLVERGLALEIPPRDFYWGRSAYLRDPDGNQIEITQKQSTSPSQG